MTNNDALLFHAGDTHALPHTLSGTRHLTVTLLGFDASAGTAAFELRNPDAQPDEMVSELIEQNREEAEASNAWRDKLHLPDRAVPVDTSTMPVETVSCTLHERLQIGDRVWTVTSIAPDGVTLTPGRDHEAHTLANEVADLEYSPEGIAIAEDLAHLDRDL